MVAAAVTAIVAVSVATAVIPSTPPATPPTAPPTTIRAAMAAELATVVEPRVRAHLAVALAHVAFRDSVAARERLELICGVERAVRKRDGDQAHASRTGRAVGARRHGIGVAVDPPEDVVIAVAAPIVVVAVVGEDRSAALAVGLAQLATRHRVTRRHGIQRVRRRALLRPRLTQADAAVGVADLADRARRPLTVGGERDVEQSEEHVCFWRRSARALSALTIFSTDDGIHFSREVRQREEQNHQHAYDFTWALLTGSLGKAMI